jgi:hypothetical protein
MAKSTKSTKKSSKKSNCNIGGVKNLELRGQTYYYRKMVGGVRKPKSLGTRDEKLAIQMAKELNRQLEMGNLGIADLSQQSYTWDQAWELYETLASVDLSANSLRAYKQRWTRCTQLFTAKGISTINGLNTLTITRHRQSTHAALP